MGLLPRVNYLCSCLLQGRAGLPPSPQPLAGSGYARERGEAPLPAPEHRSALGGLPMSSLPAFPPEGRARLRPGVLGSSLQERLSLSLFAWAVADPIVSPSREDGGRGNVWGCAKRGRTAIRRAPHGVFPARQGSKHVCRLCPDRSLGFAGSASAS